MAGTIILVILFVICVLLLLSVRLKVSVGDGKWSVSVYYTFFRVFHKESEPPPPPPNVPPKPEDLPDGEAPSPEQMPEPEETSVPESAPAASEAVQETKAADAPAEPESAEIPDLDDDDDIPDTDEPEQDEEKPKKRGFLERLKPHSLSDVMGLVEDGCGALSPSLRMLTQHLHFRHVKLYAAIGADDPADAALLYGRICAAAFPLLGQLQSWVDFQTDEFRILSDFYGNKIVFRASFELRLSPMAAIFTVLILGSKFLWRTLLRFRREDKEEKSRLKESAPIPEASH